MKTFVQTTLILAVLCAASAAFAADVPGNVCLSPCGCDYDGDGECTEDTNRLDAAGKPLLIGDKDCAPMDRKVHHGAVEIVGDGIDQDCDGADATAPAYASKFGCNPADARCLVNLEKEIASCNTSVGCDVDWTGGQILPRPGYKLLDTDCNGERDILTQTDYDKEINKVRVSMLDLTWNPRPDGRCTSDQRSHTRKSGNGKKGGGSKKATGGGVSTTKFTELDTKVAGFGEKIDGLGSRVDENTKQLGTTLKLLDGLDVAIKTETEERKAADQSLQNHINGVEGSVNRLARQTTQVAAIATDARDKANEAVRVRPSFEVAAMVAAYGQKPVSIDGSEARPGFGFMPNLKAKLGIETYNDTYRFVGTIGLPVESGRPGLHWGVGIEALWDLAPEHMLGVYGGYHYNESGGDITGSAAASRGGDIGPVYKAFLTSPEEVVSLAFLASVRVGVEQLGTKVQGEDGFAKTIAIGMNLLGEVGLAVCF